MDSRESSCCTLSFSPFSWQSLQFIYFNNYWAAMLEDADNMVCLISVTVQSKIKLSYLSFQIIKIYKLEDGNIQYVLCWTDHMCPLCAMLILKGKLIWKTEPAPPIFTKKCLINNFASDRVSDRLRLLLHSVYTDWVTQAVTRAQLSSNKLWKVQWKTWWLSLSRVG